MSRRPLLVWVVSLLAFGSGLATLFSLVIHGPHPHAARIVAYSPFEFRHLSRFLALLIGFAVSVASVQLFRRKRRAYVLVALLSGASVILHLAKGPDPKHAALSAVVLVLLILTRRFYTVGSGTPKWQAAGPGLLLGFILAVAYGVAGFWFLDRRAFGINFTMIDSIHRTIRYLFLLSDPEIVPRTRYASWFLDSLNLMTTALLAFVAISIFRPVLYSFRTHPRELQTARRILERHGRCALDYFKAWPDKSYYFSPLQNGFVAYGVAQHFAIALADPVGPEAEIPDLVSGFLDYCRRNDWGAAFYQTLPDFLPVYRSLGLKKLKVGESAIVELAGFSLEGKERKPLRHKVNQLEKILTTRLWPAPLSDAVLERAREISASWLQIPGRRERGFTLGAFETAYMRATPLFVVEDAKGRMLAFANLIPSFASGESTIDLMRYRPDAPGGIMDFLMVKLLQLQRARGFARFELGMAPMSGFEEREEPTQEERAVHLFFQQLGFLFSYQGLRHYKAKFANRWEPRYVVYRHTLDLPRIALALNGLTAIKEHTARVRLAELRGAILYGEGRAGSRA